MSINAGPSISTANLMLDLDAANPKSILSSVQVLVVAGGGGGGAYAAGAGGGGGGVIDNTNYNIQSLNTPITVTIGAGGNGGKWSPYTNPQNGGNSVFGGLTAAGGGAAGMGWGQNPGQSGGSGGGGAGYDGISTQLTVAGGSGTSGQGYAGGLGRGISTNRGAGGGGGGGGAVGGDSTTNSGGNGGIGYLSNITGTSTYYAGGGGGGDYGSGNGGVGGQGGGGNISGGNGSNLPAGNGGTNTGGGGGGSRSATSDSWNGGNGGSGTVLVRYPGSQKATGGTVSTVGSDTLHTFTSNSTFITNFLRDVTDNNRNLTLFNSVAYSSSNQGFLTFDGTDDYSTINDVNNNLRFNGSNSIFTIEAFVRINSVKRNPIFDYYSYGLEVADGNGLNFWWKTETNWYSAPATGTLTTGQWCHIAGTMQSGVGAKTYLNGVEIGSDAAAPNISTSYSWIGPYLGYTAHVSGVWTNGSVALCRVYNRALSAAEIAQNFNSARGRYGI